jgi:uncharacterized protein (DUF58 family)
MPVFPRNPPEDTEVELAELLEEVRRIEAQSNRLVAGVMAGGYSSAFRGSGIELDRIREYVDGDDPRSVDWNVTARIGRPFIKEYVEERDRTLLLRGARAGPRSRAQVVQRGRIERIDRCEDRRELQHLRRIERSRRLDASQARATHTA